MSLSVGQKAPDFSLPTIDKSMISLSSFKGKNVVLFFFPMAWTGVCTKEMCAVQEDYKAYEDMGAAILGISVDSHFVQKRFKEDFNLDGITFLSDFNKETIRAYDIVQSPFAAVYNETAKRATFVLDKEGIIRFIEILPAPGDFPNMEAIRNAVKALG